MQKPRHPGAGGASGERRQHDAAKNAAEMLALKYFQDHSAHDRGQTVTQRALRQHHDINQQQGRKLRQRDQGHETNRKAQTTGGPDPFASDPVGDMTKQYLTGNTEQADGT